MNRNLNDTVKAVFTASLLSLFTSACDCIQIVAGVVLEKGTQLPIDSAYIQKANTNVYHTYSDKNGHFELQSISGGLGGCPLMSVVIAKKGYEIITLEIENNRPDTIYLEKIHY